MKQQLYNRLAKQCLVELLTSLGTVEINREVKSKGSKINMFFSPSTSPSLGKMASRKCLFEVFTNAPTPDEVMDCLLKSYSLHGEIMDKAKINNIKLPEADLPFLWILSPTASVEFLEGFGAKIAPGWPNGVYFFPEYFLTAIVAINQLPFTEDTLWLRVLGRGKTQKVATNELVSLPAEHPWRSNILEILAIIDS